jgi:hypothetical protein
MLGDGGEVFGVVGVEGIGYDDDCEVDLTLMRTDVVLELLPLLLDVEVVADFLEGTRQPPEESAEEGHLYLKYI